MKQQQTGGLGADLAAKVHELCRVAGTLDRKDLDRLIEQVASLSGLDRWPANERYWFSGTAGVKLSRTEDRAMRDMWTCMLGQLTSGIRGAESTEQSVDTAQREESASWLRRVLTRNRVEGSATTQLERASGPDVWLAVTAVWNALCASLLSSSLDDQLRADLEVAWRSALGQTPREILDHSREG